MRAPTIRHIGCLSKEAIQLLINKYDLERIPWESLSMDVQNQLIEVCMIYYSHRKKALCKACGSHSMFHIDGRAGTAASKCPIIRNNGIHIDTARIKKYGLIYEEMVSKKPKRVEYDELLSKADYDLSILKQQNKNLVEENATLVEQNNALLTQRTSLVEQNSTLLHQNSGFKDKVVQLQGQVNFLLQMYKDYLQPPSPPSIDSLFYPSAESILYEGLEFLQDPLQDTRKRLQDIYTSPETIYNLDYQDLVLLISRNEDLFPSSGYMAFSSLVGEPYGWSTLNEMQKQVCKRIWNDSL